MSHRKKGTIVQNRKVIFFLSTSDIEIIIYCSRVRHYALRNIDKQRTTDIKHPRGKERQYLYVLSLIFVKVTAKYCCKCHLFDRPENFEQKDDTFNNTLTDIRDDTGFSSLFPWNTFNLLFFVYLDFSEHYERTQLVCLK